MRKRHSSICVIGDTHGHLQLALCLAAQWQRSLSVSFEAVFLCGDVGTFTDLSQLDSTTRRHAKVNPCELEFLTQWSVSPQPPWLARIFRPFENDGLGLQCSVVMVHGNHEGFPHLETLNQGEYLRNPVPISRLPAVDSAGFIRYLPSGWKCKTRSGVIVSGIGGIERGQRSAEYHEMAYIDESAILHLIEGGPFDILITHQGPAKVQGPSGSPNLDYLLEKEICRYWFHGHSTPNMAIQTCGPKGETVVVPLGDIAFPMKGEHTEDSGKNGFCHLSLGDPDHITRERPEFWREYRKRKWKQHADGLLIAPQLVSAGS